MTHPTTPSSNAPPVWTIVTREGKRIEDVTDAQIRELLYRKKIHPEDWAATSESLRGTSPAMGTASMQQLCLIDRFANVASTARRKRRRPQEPDAEMDMTPMIDVVFLLLIFFMITATFHLQTGMGFPPDQTEDNPSTQTQAPGLEQFDDRVIIEINEKDEFFVRTSQGSGPPIPVENLVDAVRAESNTSNQNKAFVVAHEMASLEAIVKAFDVAAEVGISDVALADVTTPAASSSGSGPLQIQRNGTR